MKIKVEVRNKILGNSIFWQGDSKDIDQIRNIPARYLAKEVLKKGGIAKSGMWYVTEEK